MEEPRWKMSTWFGSPEHEPAVSAETLDRRRLAVCNTEIERRASFHAGKEQLLAARWTWGEQPSLHVGNWTIELILLDVNGRLFWEKYTTWPKAQSFPRWRQDFCKLTETGFFLLLNEPGWHLVNS